ncbi:MAG: DUF928 domain-containing protein [Leptolyngbya sp. SIOISBB]|nr:DUF928 domain-containing protein [Leptolyngbya sp. SIOISBB]
MTSPFTMHRAQLLRRLLVVGSALSLLLVLSSSSLANRNERPTDPSIPGALRAYVPPSDPGVPRDDHTGGGVRGCGDDIAALAPRLNSVGQTASTNPTFVWYNFSDESDPIEFQLYRFEPDGSFDTVAVEQFETSQQGYMAYTLPFGEAELTVGEAYLWQVVIYCDRNFEEPGQYSSAEIEVVALPAELATALPDDSLGRAQTYASNGLWYDALAEVYDATDATAKALRRDLLLDLADLEEQPDGAEAELITELRAIAEK